MAERVLDDALREQLSGLLPFSVDSSKSWTPDEYKEVPDEFRPVFKIRPFRKSEHNRATTLFKAKETDTKELHSLVRVCLVGWTRLMDIGTGEYIEYRADEAGGCDKELFSGLPEWLIAKMLIEITNISGMLPVGTMKSLKS